MEFTFGNIRIKISFLFFLMLTMSFAADRNGITYTAVVSVVIHELSHIAAMAAISRLPNKISFGVFGIRIEHSEMTYREEIFVALAGPVSNIIASLIAAVFAKTGFADFWNNVCVVNAGIAAFNLLPAAKLDGAVALRAFLSLRFSPFTVSKLANAVSAVLILVLTVSGAALAYLSKGNLSLLFTGAYLAVRSIKGLRNNGR